MEKLTHEKVNQMLDAHEAWLSSNGEKGKQADFTHTNVSGFHFKNRNLSQAICIEGSMTHNTFDNCTMSGMNCLSSNMIFNQYNNCMMDKMNLHDAVMDYSQFYGDVMDFSNMDHTSMQKTSSTFLHIKGAVMDFSNWDDSTHTRLQLENCYADQANLCAKFPEANIIGLEAKTADIRGAGLSSARILDSKLPERFLQIGPIEVKKDTSTYIGYLPKSDLVQCPPILKDKSVSMKEFEKIVDKLPKNYPSEKTVRNNLKGAVDMLKFMDKVSKKGLGR